MNDRKFDIEGASEILKAKTVGQWVADGLQEIADELKKGKKDKKNIGNKFTCHKMALDLVPTTYSADMVKATRKKLECSQAIFARFLGVSISSVRNWEQGVNTPEHVACRLMDEIRHDPKYWKTRLRQLVTRKKTKVVIGS